jgi:predicted PurR-regulated permease PerM
LAAVPGVLAGLAVSPTTALWVALLYLLIQQIESNLIQPVAMRWAVRIAPGMLVVWQIAFATAFGLPPYRLPPCAKDDYANNLGRR